MEQFVTVPQAATILGVTARRVRQLIAEGRLEEVSRAGRTVILERSAVEALAREGWRGRRGRP